jgi:hypothetical protein
MVIFMRFGRQVLPFEVTSTSHGLGLFGWCLSYYWDSFIVIIVDLFWLHHIQSLANVTMATIACSDNSITLDSYFK